jgi:hypothetical protein
MVQCSKHAIPLVVPIDLTDQQAHDLELELERSGSGSADLLAARQPASSTQLTSWSIPIRLQVDGCQCRSTTATAPARMIGGGPAQRTTRPWGSAFVAGEVIDARPEPGIRTVAAMPLPAQYRLIWAACSSRNISSQWRLGSWSSNGASREFRCYRTNALSCICRNVTSSAGRPGG